MKNIGTTLLISSIVLALVIFGIGYALWSENLYITGEADTGELDWGFTTTVSTMDHGLDYNGDPAGQCFYAYQVDKDVGSSSYQLLNDDCDGDYELLKVTLNNVYPRYLEDISFHVVNTGTIPLRIWKVIIGGNEYYAITGPIFVDLNGDGIADVRICWGDNFGVQIEPGQVSGEISFEIIVLQNAPQGTTLTLTISLVAVQWNEYSTP